MNRTTTTMIRSAAVLAALGLLAAACGGDDDDDAGGASADVTSADVTSGTTEGGSDTTTGATTGGSVAGGAGDLTSCPDPFVIQTDWFPEAEHGSLYQLIGDDYTVDVDNKVVSGPLLAGGEDSGLTLEVRAGGPAIGDQPVSVQQYADDSITLGYATTEAQVLRYEDNAVISVIAPLEINPQIIYWDPETYPDVETLADLGEENVTINVFGGGTFSEVFVAQGIWNADQIDPSYDGSPARFISEDGKIAQQGFASAEPYKYENEFTDWGKPIAYQTLHDAGFEVYSQTLSVRPDMLEDLRPCLEAFVPLVQQAAIDYLDAPERANAMIIDAVTQYDTFWTYDEGLAEYSVQTQKELGLVGNGPDDTLGNMEEDRIQGAIDQIRDAGLDVPEDLEASDIFTNEFIDESIGVK
jgi:hypothetical protein